MHHRITIVGQKVPFKASNGHIHYVGAVADSKMDNFSDFNENRKQSFKFGAKVYEISVVQSYRKNDFIV